MPNTDTPIACSLDAASLTERIGELRALGRDALLGAETAAGRSTLRFAPGAETRARLAAVVAAEATCCAFLSFTLADAPDAIVMTISAPEGAEPVVAELVAAVSAGRAAA
jgi:hypothetical protein